jgi:hypothetical protein
MHKLSVVLILVLFSIVPFAFAGQNSAIAGDEVSAYYPNVNYGTDTIGGWFSQIGGSKDAEQYWTYNLSNVTSTIQSANLSVYIRNTYSLNSSVYIVGYFCNFENASFLAKNLTWNNKGNITATCDSTPIFNVSSTTLSATSRNTFTSTNLATFINNDANKNFTLRIGAFPQSFDAYSRGSEAYGFNNTATYQPYIEYSFSTTTPTLSVVINSPANETSSSTKQNISYTMQSSTDATANCKLYIDSVLNATNAATANDTATLFTPNWNPGAHTYYVTCTDSVLTNQTASYSFTYDRSLIVTSISPADHFMSGQQRNVTFSAADNKITPFSCSLYVDDVLNQTNAAVVNDTVTTFPMLWMTGSYLWNITCNDGEITGYSETRAYTFNSSHNILLYSPDDNTRTNVAEQIVFEVYDSDNTTTACVLYIDGALNQSNGTILNDTVSYFTPAWTQGVHYWNITCVDGLTTVHSASRSFDYDTTTPFIQSGTPTSFNTTAFTGFTMRIKGNVTDDNLWRVNRTIRYPNGTVFVNNYSGDLAPLTTFYGWDDSYNTTAMPNGFYSLYIEAADSHTAEDFAPAIAVTEDISAKKISYDLTYDTVGVALIGGDTEKDVVDVTTEKLPDRYTFEFVFDRPIVSGDTSIFRVTSQYPIIYLPDSPYKGHFILANKYWLDFENYNGDVTVEKVDDYTYDVTVVVKDSKEYTVIDEELPMKTGDEATALSFYSLGGLNEGDLLISFEINNCVPDWVCGGYGSCNVSDYAPCNSATDNNACGLPYGGDLSEFAPQSCNFCSRNIVSFNQSGCANNSFTHCYNDTNFVTCCDVTGLASDCYGNTPQNASMVCVAESCSMFEYGANDITGAAIDTVARLVIGVASVIFLVAFIYVGVWGYNRIKMRR